MLNPAVSSAGAFGKMPGHGEFIRVHRGDPAAQSFADWLHAAFELKVKTSGAVPKSPTSFAFAAPGARQALVGAMVPSRDRVGRNFPMAVFVPVDSSALANSFALIPLAFKQFLNAAVNFLKDLDRFADPADFARELNMLPLPSSPEWTAAEAERQLELSKSTATLIAPVSDFSETGAAHYAVRTFVTACNGEKDREPQKTRVVLDCPLGPEGPLPWLDLASRILRWRDQPPSFVWADNGPSRLLFSLGPLPPAALVYLGNPDPAIRMFWPLTTPHAKAREAAKLGFSEQQRELLEQGQSSLETFFSSLLS